MSTSLTLKVRVAVFPDYFGRYVSLLLSYPYARYITGAITPVVRLESGIQMPLNTGWQAVLALGCTSNARVVNHSVPHCFHWISPMSLLIYIIIPLVALVPLWKALYTKENEWNKWLKQQVSLCRFSEGGRGSSCSGGLRRGRPRWQVDSTVKF